jgi:hypothetical protein
MQKVGIHNSISPDSTNIVTSFFYPQEDIVEQGSIALAGDEKNILAYQLEEEDMEAGVTPAISDL